MKKITAKTFAGLGLIFASVLHAQIKFDNPDFTVQNKNYQRADSAIKAGEFGDVHSLLIVLEGELVFEKYYKGWHADSLHQLQSATKSIVATLYGCALQQGMVGYPKTKIATYYEEIPDSDPLKKQICIEDLMTQRHGLKWIEGAWEDPKNTWRKVLESPGNWYQRVLETPMDTAPGTKFVYSNAAPLLTAGLLQKATNMNIDAFAKKYLFDPLQIKKYTFWGGNGGPQNNGMALLSLRSRDMAKIGQLYLNRGVWNHFQIVPAEFIKAATSAHVKNVGANGVYTGYDYGYFWWSNPVWRANNQTVDIYLARGAGGQNIIIFPEKNLVVVITAWNMQQPNKPEEIFEKYILSGS